MRIVDIYQEINQVEIGPELKPLWVKLSRFVDEICRGRDPSHGHAHMQQVALDSLYILKCLNDNSINPELVITTAWLHDVADHKYDHDGSLLRQIESFLDEIMPDKKEIVIKLIEHVSFSKQKKIEVNGQVNWEEIFGDYAIIRHICSDADKIEALGFGGIVRCMGYGYLKIKGTLEEPYLEKKAIYHLRSHSEYKLLKLKDGYIITEPGKRIAEILHREFEDILNDDDKLSEIYHQNMKTTFL